jgi:hypothetical protein
MILVHASNVATALSIAITARAQEDARMGYTGPTAQLEGWMDMLAALQRGEEVRIMGLA